MRFPTLLIPLTLLLLAQNPTTHAKQIDVEWDIPKPGESYSDGNASVGDTISFKWHDNGPPHNVYYHPTGTCSVTDAEKVGDESDKSEYVIKESDAGSTLTFACDKPYHCDFGQIVKFTVGESKVIEIEWKIPAPGESLPDGNASVGDTLSFSWPEVSGYHNVYYHPTGTCSDTGAEKVGDVFDNTEYVIKESDAGSTLTFACDVEFHCEFGQKVQFTVAALTSSPTGEPTSSPTGEPSSSPTEPPTPIPTPQPTPPEDDCTEDPNAKFIVKRKNKKNLKKKCKWLAKQQKKKIRNYCKKKKGTKKIEPPKVACRITCEICEPE